MSRTTLVEGSAKLRAIRGGALLAGALIVILAPILSGDASQIERWSEIAAYAVAILGLSLVTGYCGQISIGHSVFVGIGGYTTIILVANHGWPYLATIPVAALVCLGAGAVVGIPALRISGLYLVTVTLAIAAVFPSVIDKFTGLTGGTNGMVTRQMSAPGWFPFDMTTQVGPAEYHYFVIVAIAAVMFVSGRQLVRSRIGRAFIAIRESPYSAAASGIAVARYKVYAFAISAAFAGVAGCLLVIETPQVADTRFDLNLAVFLLIGLIAGGRNSIWGAIPGGVIVVILLSYINNWFDALKISNGSINDAQLVGIVSGCLLIAFAFVLPGGVLEGLQRLVRPFVRVIRPPAEGWKQFQLEPLADGPSTRSSDSTSPLHPSALPDRN